MSNYEIIETPDDGWVLLSDDGTLATGALSPTCLLEYAARRYMARTFTGADLLAVRQLAVLADVEQRLTGIDGLQVSIVGGVYIDVCERCKRTLTAFDHAMVVKLGDYERTACGLWHDHRGRPWWSVSVKPDASAHGGWMRELGAAAAWAEWGKTKTHLDARGALTVPIVPTPAAWGLLRELPACDPDTMTPALDTEDEDQIGVAYRATTDRYRMQERAAAQPRA